jgi:hypothetical protein
MSYFSLEEQVEEVGEEGLVKRPSLSLFLCTVSVMVLFLLAPLLLLLLPPQQPRVPCYLGNA